MKGRGTVPGDRAHYEATITRRNTKSTPIKDTEMLPYSLKSYIKISFILKSKSIIIDREGETSPFFTL
jgi:hypothetical protein